MAHYQTHLALAANLLSDMRSGVSGPEQLSAVDAGYYAVFHAMEAINATECRNSHSFADAGEILDAILARRFLDESFVDDYNFLFYFRRGVIYGAHFPFPAQMERFREVVERAYGRAVLAANEAANRYELQGFHRSGQIS